MEPSQKPVFGVPVAIIIAGVLIAGAVYMSGRGSSNVATNTPPAPTASGDIKPVTSADHIFGNPNAEIKIVEFSDMECPFCKGFHQTLKKIVDEYGKDGKVAWVYRHFPLDSLHPKAKKEAEATECAAELGGETVFWNYLNKIYEITPSNNQLDPIELSNTAVAMGINRASFDKCLASGKYTKKVEDQVKDAIAGGGRGTPFSVIVTKEQNIPITQGALPYADMKQLVDAIIKGK